MGAGHRIRRFRSGWLVAALGVLCVLFPSAASALELGGALNWTFGRTEQTTPRSNYVRTQFDQWYQLRLSSNIVRRELASLSIGGGWRRSKLRDYGTGGGVGTSGYTLTDLHVALSMLPTRLPMSLTFDRSISEDEGGQVTANSTFGSNINFSMRIPMPDGNPVGVTFNQSKQDSGLTSDTTSRLSTLSKRLDLGSHTRVNASYRYSQFLTDTSELTAHGGSLSSDTDWTDRLASNLYANYTSQNSAQTRIAAGRNVFLSNNYGGALRYRNGAVANGTLSYSYTETPVSSVDEIRQQQLYGRGTRRVGTRLDLRGNFALRRMQMQTSDMDTVTTSAGFHYRPRFGWTTGVTASLAHNEITDPTGATTSNYNAVSGNAYMTARHDLRPVHLNWGLNTHFSSASGNNAEDRLAWAASVSAADRTIDWIRLRGSYRLSEIRESVGGAGGLQPHSREHMVMITGALKPKTRVWLDSDVLSANFSSTVKRNQTYFDNRDFFTTQFDTNVQYRLRAGLQTHAEYQYYQNTDDLQGARQQAALGAQLQDNVFLRGTQQLEGEVRRVWLGGETYNQNSTLRYMFNYSVGLLTVSMTGELIYTSDQSGIGNVTTTNLRLNIMRTF